MIGAGSTIVPSRVDTTPSRTPTPLLATTSSRASPQRGLPSVSPDMSHVSVIVVGGVGENDSIHVIDSSLATTTSSQRNVPTTGQVIERSCSSASHSSNASSLGTGMSISSSSNSTAFNTKLNNLSLQEEDESLHDQDSHKEKDNMEKRGPSQNSLRVEGTTLDETEEDMLEDSISYNQLNGHIPSQGNTSSSTHITGQPDSEEDSGMIDDTRIAKLADEVIAELPCDLPAIINREASPNINAEEIKIDSSSRVQKTPTVVAASSSSKTCQKKKNILRPEETSYENSPIPQGQHQHPVTQQRQQQRYIKTQRSVSS